MMNGLCGRGSGAHQVWTSSCRTCAPDAPDDSGRCHLYPKFALVGGRSTVLLPRAGGAQLNSNSIGLHAFITFFVVLATTESLVSSPSFWSSTSSQLASDSTVMIGSVTKRFLLLFPVVHILDNHSIVLQHAASSTSAAVAASLLFVRCIDI